jgi:hypothetical protein
MSSTKCDWNRKDKSLAPQDRLLYLPRLSLRTDRYPVAGLQCLSRSAMCNPGARVRRRCGLMPRPKRPRQDCPWGVRVCPQCMSRRTRAGAGCIWVLRYAVRLRSERRDSAEIAGDEARYPDLVQERPGAAPFGRLGRRTDAENEKRRQSLVAASQLGLDPAEEASSAADYFLPTRYQQCGPFRQCEPVPFGSAQGKRDGSEKAKAKEKAASPEPFLCARGAAAQRTSSGARIPYARKRATKSSRCRSLRHSGAEADREAALRVWSPDGAARCKCAEDDWWPDRG